MEFRETLTMSMYMHICPNIQIPKRAWVVYTLGGRDWVHYSTVQAVRSLRKLCQLAYCSRDVKESFKGGNFLQISCDSTHDKGPFHSSNWWQGGVMKSHLTLFSIYGWNHLLFLIGLILFLLGWKILLGYSFLQILPSKCWSVAESLSHQKNLVNK